jgi:hypothetical protein
VWATATYYRLRLATPSSQPAAKARYGEIAALMPEIERSQSRSTINLFADLQSGVAPSLDLFLKTATRLSPVSIQAEPGEGYPDTQPNYSGSSKGATLSDVDLGAPETPHLNAETALIFNQRMPLQLLREAALSTELTDNVRFQVAHMAWTRALLLDDPETARAIGPYLVKCQPAFKPWLDQYAAAKTPEERHVLGLLALMRFTSTEPTVRTWHERDFASYDYMRDNWWCDTTAWQSGSPNVPRPPHLFSQFIIPREVTPTTPAVLPPGSPYNSLPGVQPDPPFLTAADRAAADREVAQLQKVGLASDYFAREALAWVKAHPNDPRNADVLGFAMRVVRNACRSDATKELNHQLFDTLHRRYPQSEWAAKYTTWE